jgi:putative ABC transport system permease protein
MGLKQSEDTQQDQRTEGIAGLKRGHEHAHRTRPGFRSALRLALKRIGRARGMLVLLGLGILVADTLICTVPLYSALMANVQLRHELSSAEAAARNAEIQVTTPAGPDAPRQQSRQAVEALQSRYLGSFTAPDITYYITSREFLLLGAGNYQYDASAATGGLAPEGRLEAFDYAASGPHMRLLSGRLPTAADSGPVPGVLLTREMADETGVKLGDVVTVGRLGNLARTISGRVVGIWEPKDPYAPYWNGHHFAAHQSAGPDEAAIYPILFTYDGFFAEMAPNPDLPITQHWVSYTQPARITTENMGTVADAIQVLRGRVQILPGTLAAVFLGSLDQIIDAVRRQQALLVLPLYIVAAQVVALALFFATAMASLLIDAQGQDIANLKSRGISRLQLLGAFGTQGLILAAFAVLAGPAVAVLVSLQLVQRLLPTATLEEADVSAGALLRVIHPGSIAAPAVAGALLGAAAIVFAALQASQLDVLAFHRESGRARRQPFWRRYYLDLALVALCGVGFLEMGQFGTTGVRLDLGQRANSPLLLLTPALMLSAGALLVLRVAPAGAHLGARLAARGRGLVALLAFSNAERHPGRYARMLLLLVLAVGLGIFALNFDASLAHNAADHIDYQAGSDIRVAENAPVGMQQAAARERELGNIPGVAEVSPVYRDYAGFGSQNLQLLGIDPGSFARVSGARAWRSDYADLPLDALVRHLQAHAGDNVSSGLWALVSEATAERMHLKVGDPFALQMEARSGAANVNFVVGGVVRYFPTLYPDGAPLGFVVTNLSNVATALAGGTADPAYTAGPNEFWLRTTGAEQGDAAIARRLDQQRVALDISTIVSRSDLLAETQSNPVSVGMRGLLLVGALTAGLLALMGSIAQAVISARQRTAQFALLRTLGVGRSQVTRILLGEQLIVYLFGMLGGTLLGLLLSTATLPFLQFSDNGLDAAQIGVPPYALAPNPLSLAAFYAVLLVAFGLALAIAARYANVIGLGKALRVGED